MLNILKDLLAERCGGPDQVRAVHRGIAPEAYAEMRLPGAMVLKEHELTAEAVELAEAFDVAVVGTIREPTEAIASLVSTFGWSVEAAVAGVGRAMATLELFGDGIVLIRYDSMITERPRSMQALLGTLGLDCGWWQARELCLRYSHRRMTKATASLDLPDGHRWDPETLFHPGHVGTPHQVRGEEPKSLEARVHGEGLHERYEALLSRAR